MVYVDELSNTDPWLNSTRVLDSDVAYEAETQSEVCYFWLEEAGQFIFLDKTRLQNSEP